jgi:anti-sigma factor (TIGR02949 family)
MTDENERTIRCQEAMRLLAAYLDDELTRLEHLDVERHLEACRSCYSRAEFERRLKAQLADLGRREPEPEFGARLRGLVRRFTRGSEADPRLG